jgi:hypothetical protein
LAVCICTNPLSTPLAIKRRNAKMLPIGANVEEQNEKKDLWTFVIFVAALLHDLYLH